MGRVAREAVIRMRYFIYSNIFIDYLRGYEPTIEALKSYLRGDNTLFISAITNLEVHAGKSITQLEVLENLEQFFSRATPVDITFEIAGIAGDFRRQYQTSVPDALIAASAYSLDALLITRNLKHFQPIKEIRVQSI